ncbi:protein FAR1-RELATED SEQUENCE 5-like isoform X2 [Andrographis paniculata]|uniref:protein FAR1-RELATED SEQUENCE 5-like isoform X1 n=1 Tax=Andrographis paniculata TaxID=175694 RepID=UPI0021E7CEA7|nr:protein FAR1-RELATED SEQUENCE 5-like isoform X1 [Andrographis paniculata]XP_051145668.1 protein FAR1-RELATED SEQUENCE 5-like isoform X2 [Andrographis paniculata]
MDVENRLDSGNGMIESCDGMIESSFTGDLTSFESDKHSGPYEGMVFDSEAAAKAYYNEYAARAGFSTRVLSSHKSEHDGSVISRGLGCRNNSNVQKSGNVCSDAGEKREDGCAAVFVIKRESEGKWIVRKFVRDHNHPLVVSSPKRWLTFDEKDKRIQELTAELRIKKRLSAAYKEQLLILMKDVENHNDHLTSKIHIIRNNLTELEGRRQEFSGNTKPNF